MDDALAVLDHFAIDRAWAIGHSWGGHLALHLLVAHPERLLGMIGIDALGAHATFGEQDTNLRRGLSEEQIARVDEVEELRRRGEATKADLFERFAILWRQYFADPESAPPPPAGDVGVECSRDTNASIGEHFERGTLVQKLPEARVAVLFVHGELDPLPVSASADTAALIPGAKVETVSGCGHFPWLERPGEVRRAVERHYTELTAQR
jgi:proline iminopeptidase